jgi:DNA-binding response OmpR family regulator
VLVHLSPDRTPLEEVRKACAELGWKARVEPAPDRLSWTAQVHRPAVIIIFTTEGERYLEAVAAVRAVSRTTVALVGDLQPANVVDVLGAGADVVIPAGRPGIEVLSRAHAVIRRSADPLTPTTRYLVAGPLRVDLWRRAAHLSQNDLGLTATEFELLAHLMRNAERTVEFSSVLDRVWGYDATETNTLRLCIARLRRKLGEQARKPALIESVRGHGYQFTTPVVEVADERRTGGIYDGVPPRLEAVSDIIRSFSTAGTRTDLARLLVGAVVSNGIADAAAVQHLDRSGLRLTAHQGLSQRWVRRTGTVLPATGTFACLHTVTSGRPVQHLSEHPQHRDTALVLSGEDHRSVLFLPLTASRTGNEPEEVIGCLGLLRRDRPLPDASAVTFARTIGTAYTALVSTRSA